MRGVVAACLLALLVSACSMGSLPISSGFTQSEGDDAETLSWQGGKATAASTATTTASEGIAARLDPVEAVRLLNEMRAEHGLKPVRLEMHLMRAAKAHSRDLAKADHISHYGSDGSSPWDRVKATGYRAQLAAENVGTGQTSVEELFKAWAASEDHMKNLLLADAEEVGIALVENDASENRTFWTLVIGKPL